MDKLKRNKQEFDYRLKLIAISVIIIIVAIFLFIIIRVNDNLTNNGKELFIKDNRIISPCELEIIGSENVTGIIANNIFECSGKMVLNFTNSDYLSIINNRFKASLTIENSSYIEFSNSEVLAPLIFKNKYQETIMNFSDLCYTYNRQCVNNFCVEDNVARRKQC